MATTATPVAVSQRSRFLLAGLSLSMEVVL